MAADGRQRDRASLAAFYRRRLDEPCTVIHPSTGEEVEATVEDAIALAIIRRAIAGDVRAFRYIQDCLHGRHVRRSRS